MSARQDEVCARHGGQPAMSHCTSCGKPICRECTQEFGYFCGPECLEESRSHISADDRQRQHQAEAELDRAASVGRWIGIGLGVLALLAVGFLAWKLLLDPAGKLAWSWEREGGLYEFRVVSGDDDAVLVRAGDEILTLDARKGEQVGAVSLSRDGASRGRAVIESVADGFLVFRPKEIARYDHSGKEVFVRTTEWERLESCRSRDGAFHFVCLGSPRPTLSYAERLRRKTGLPAQKVVVSCLDLTSGKPVWTHKIEDGARVRALSVSASICYALHESRNDDDDMKTLLRAYDIDSGKPRWEAELSASPGWGPEAVDEAVLLEVDDTLFAFSEDGRELWSQDVGSAVGARKLLGDALLISGVNGTRLLDVRTGNERWQSPVALSPGSIQAVGGHILGVGVVTAGSSPAGSEDDGAALPGSLEKNKDLLEDMGVDLTQLGKGTPDVPSLVCVDADTGQIVWDVPKIYGDVYADAERIVVVMDTVRTSALEAVSGGKGVLVIRQYDPENGSLMYSRNSEMGLLGPVLCGKRLVGVLYERKERPSLLGGGMGGQASVPKALGVGAFRLR